jgi:hypothetical protein
LHQPSLGKTVTENVTSGIPMEWVEAYASREGFVLPRDKKLLWAHSVRLHPILQHVTELGTMIPTSKWQCQ